MKKIATILMLVVAILVGGMTMDANTTKKKGKSRTTQSASSKSSSKKDQMIGKLKKYRNQDTAGYFITDINNDGSPELWIYCYGEVSNDNHMDIYYFDKKGFLKKDVLQTGRRASDFCYKNSKLYLAYEDIVYEISLKNDKIHRNVILDFEIDYDGDGEPKSFSTGSKQLWQVIQNIPVIEYYPVTATSHLNKYFK